MNTLCLNDEYDASFFAEKEIIINELKKFIENEDYKDEEWRKICYNLVETYEMIVDLYRIYIDCNEEMKEECWLDYYKAHTILNEALEFMGTKC